MSGRILAYPTLLAFCILFASCGDQFVAPPEPEPVPRPEALIFARSLSTSIMSPVYVAGVWTSERRAFVAFGKGELPGIEAVKLRNLTTGESDPARYHIEEGLLDPVGIGASVGDELELELFSEVGPVGRVRARVPASSQLRVIRTTPADGELEVARRGALTVVFSEPVDAATVSTSSVMVQHNSTPVPGTLAVVLDHLSVRLYPSGALAGATPHELVITTDVKSRGGSSLQNAVKTSFATAPAVGTVLILTSTDGADYPSAGYTLSVGSESIQVRLADGVARTVAEGSIHVALDTPSNCIVRSGNEPVVVIADDTVTVDMRIDCQRIGPMLLGTLAFVSERNGDAEIYSGALSPVGAAPTITQLTFDPDWDEDPAWSPDGSRIASTSKRSPNGWDYIVPVLVVADADGSNRVSRTYDTGSNVWPVMAMHPAWSPDGSRITLVNDVTGWGDWSVMTVSATDDRRAPERVASVTQSAFHPAWSPDGTMLAMVSWQGVILVHRAGTPGTAFLTASTGLQVNTQPAWSPDGSRIAYVNAMPIHENGVVVARRLSVWLMDANGSGKQEITWAGDALAHDQQIYSLAWSPDGETIAFSYIDCNYVTGRCTGARSIRYVRVATGQQGTLIDDAHSPDWKY